MSDGLGKDYEYAFLERRVQTPFEDDVLLFHAATVDDAKEFCVANRWSTCEGFEAAWKQLRKIVDSFNMPRQNVEKRKS